MVNLENFLPHRKPMLLLDGIEFHNQDVVRSRISPCNAEWLGGDVAAFPAIWAVEWMAQTAAFWMTGDQPHARFHIEGKLVIVRNVVWQSSKLDSGARYWAEVERNTGQGIGLNLFRGRVGKMGESEPCLQGQVGIWVDSLTPMGTIAG